MIGKITNTAGVLEKNDNFIVVRKKIGEGENIAEHSHPEHNVFFVPIKGEFNVTLNKEEKHRLVVGDVLSFDGKHSLSAEVTPNSEVIIFLTKK